MEIGQNCILTISFHEYASKNDAHELYVIDDLESPLVKSARIIIDKTKNYPGNKANEDLRSRKIVRYMKHGKLPEYCGDIIQPMLW